MQQMYSTKCYIHIYNINIKSSQLSGTICFKWTNSVNCIALKKLQQQAEFKVVK